MSAALQLKVFKDGESLQSLEIDREILIGRGEECVVRLQSPKISRKHLVLRPTQEGVRAESKSQFSLLKVNGAESEAGALLRAGDVIELGPYLVRLESSLASPAPVQSAEPLPQVREPVSTQETVPEPLPIQDDLATLESHEGQVVTESPEVLAVEELDMAGTGSDAGLGDLGNLGDLGAGHSEAPSSQDFSEDGKTRVTTALRIAAKLIIPPGFANVTEVEMLRDEISVGRGRDCDVVLSDKRSSKKHLVIRRAGTQFLLKDLGSTNGTLLNGERLTESEIAHGDRIQIGDVEMVFEAISSDYADKQAEFLSVAEESPPALEGAAYTPDQSGYDSPVALSGVAAQFDGQGGMPGALDIGGTHSDIPGVTGMAGDVPGLSTPPKRKELGLIARFRALNQRQQILAGVIILLVLGWLIEDGEPEKKPTDKKPKPTVSARPSNGPKTFETLSADEQNMIRQRMNIATSAYGSRQYETAIEATRMVLLILPTYEPAKLLQDLATTGNERKKQAEAEALRIQQEKEQQLKIEALIEETSALMKKKSYAKAEEKFGEILSTDPENARVAEWKKIINEEHELQENRKREQEQDRQLRALMHERYLEAKALFDEKKYYEAIDASKRVEGKATSGDKKAAEALAAASRKAIDDGRDPLLKAGREAEAAGEMTKAFDLFRKATEADYLHREGYDAMKRIRGVLHERGRKLYREGVLSEYFNDVPEALSKFNEILAVVPVDDEYHARAVRKLIRYGQEIGRKPASPNMATPDSQMDTSGAGSTAAPAARGP